MNKLVKLDAKNKIVVYECDVHGRPGHVEIRGFIPCYLGGGVCGNCVTKVDKSGIKR